MKRLATYVAIILLAASVQGATAMGDGDGYTPFVAIFIVEADTAGWQPTGIVVSGGVSITATGEAACSFDTANHFYCSGYFGPDGRPGIEPPGSPIAPDLTAYSLVGRIDGGEPFLVGKGPTIALGNGDLELAYNDDSFGDNDGAFTATVTSCRPVKTNGVTSDCIISLPGQA